MNDHATPADATPWWQYISKGLEHAGITQSRLADLTGMPRPSVTRWRTAAVLPRDPDTIRRVAQILQTPITEPLVALGYLTEEEAERFERGKQLDDYTTKQLLAELERRIEQE